MGRGWIDTLSEQVDTPSGLVDVLIGQVGIPKNKPVRQDKTIRWRRFELVIRILGLKDTRDNVKQ